MIYLDNSATTRVLPEAADTAYACMREDYYNPSSAYAPAAALEKKIEAARARLAAALGCMPPEVVYTSGATESNNAAILGTLKMLRGKKKIVTSVVEHPSVYEVFRALEGAPEIEPVFLPVDASGAVRLDDLSAALTPDVAFVSLMQVNNEVGAINDLAGAAAIIRKRAPNAVFHVDGVQGFCKQPFSRLPCDLYSLSGHKFHAPKGVGALYVRQGVRFFGGQLGGGQESNRRSGTTNAPGILAMDEALAFCRQNYAAHQARMRSCKLRLYQNLSRIPDTLVNGPAPEGGAAHILNLSFPGVRGEVLLHALSERGLLVSTGSACSAHKKGKNRVLSAMGIVGVRQESAIRFSLSPFNTPDEMDLAATIVAENVAFLRRYQRR